MSDNKWKIPERDNTGIFMIVIIILTALAAITTAVATESHIGGIYVLLLCNIAISASIRFNQK